MRIIERDSKDTTYKFALLRAVIDLSQEYAHLKQDRGDQVEFPLGLLIEKWLLFYYPLIEKWLLFYYPLVDSPRFIPQKNGEGPEGRQELAISLTGREEQRASSAEHFWKYRSKKESGRESLTAENTSYRVDLLETR